MAKQASILAELICLVTAPLRYELGDRHTWDFVQGTITWPMAPGKKVSIYNVLQTLNDCLLPPSASEIGIMQLTTPTQS